MVGSKRKHQLAVHRQKSQMVGEAKEQMSRHTSRAWGAGSGVQEQAEEIRTSRGNKDK
jgi:hypothetical protein